MRAFLTTICLASLLGTSSFAAPVQFNRDVRPILSETCFHCHGPDEAGRKAKLRFDTEAAITENAKGWRPIVPGNPEASEAWARIITDDPDDLMPPPDSHLALDAEQKAILKQWIQEGAQYEKHWAMVPPKKHEIGKSEFRNPIDYFIARRHKEKGLQFSPAADKSTLLRRVYLDLTGLPPSIEAVETFIADTRADAFERVVDDLLKSNACAERLALDWLDVARYADTNGYSIDDHRDMWAWRDWVIHAFLNNKPYDQFVQEQIAGDLFPNATDQHKVATGFLRNSMNTHEGGTIAEEYRVAYVADKVDTVATAFMGLTMKCAQCHDHKYDPISQKDYYRFFAFFNTSGEPGKGKTNANTGPLISVKSVLQDDAAFNAALDQRIESLRENLLQPAGELGQKKLAWEHVERTRTRETKLPGEAAGVAPLSFPVPEAGIASLGANWIWSDGAAKAERAYFRRALVLDAAPEEAVMFLSCDNEAEVWVNGEVVGRNPDWREPTLLDLTSKLKRGRNIIAVAGKDWEGGSMAGLLAMIAYSFEGSKTQYVVSDHSWLVTADPEVEDWQQLGAVPGFSPPAILKRYGASPYGKVFEKLKPEAISENELVRALRTPRPFRNAFQKEQLRDAFAKANPDMQKVVHSVNTEIKILEASRKQGSSTVMVMDESQAARKTHILIRGQYDQHGEVVTAGVPSAFSGLPSEAEANRLDLARWLTEPDHPLTSRVAVNRIWQLLFGTGLVKTSEDFGSQGEWPSHPALLDHLAVEFVEQGWDLRGLIKRIVLSKTYQQRSANNPQLQEVDPYNRLLARAPRYRLSAELLRDYVLAVSGLLSPQVGGPSVYPYQPQGLWKEVSHFGHPTVFTAQHFFRDMEHGLYRRSMYTFWKRTSPPPTMAAFDAPTRETCTVRRLLTNTPLQALVLMNDPQYVEAARALAQKVWTISDQPVGRINRAFYEATGRQPTAEEAAVLQRAYQRQLDYFNQDTDRAEHLLAVGELEIPANLPATELAALASVTSLILNLDETITRE